MARLTLDDPRAALEAISGSCAGDDFDDFADVERATQSWLRALRFEVLRAASAKRTPISVVNARPAVRSSLELVENDALAG